MKTHKPCESLRITFKVTQTHDQYGRVSLLPAISQHGCGKVHLFLFSRKTTDLLKVDSVFSQCFCGEEGDSGGG